jgi:DNA uptake protein ComE-like DNA-binding protein
VGIVKREGCAENHAVRLRIFIPILGTAIGITTLAWAQTVPVKHAIPPPEARVDINHAALPELLKVPGMTETWAKRIVRFRPYHTKQDLLEKGIVDSAEYDRIKEFVIAHRDPH